jgi:uncharacterized protein
MITRDLESEIRQAAENYPVVTVVGPRQSGKTTLVRALFPEKPYRSLENPDERAFAIEDPRGFLGQFNDGVILDEVQRVPDLLSYLQGSGDDDPRPGRYILAGSQHFLLMRDVSQSLAGRTAVLTLLPLSMAELGDGLAQRSMEEVLFGGFYPRIYARPIEPYRLLRDYFATYVERDVRSLLKVHDLHRFETFLRLCAGRVGQLLNLTALAADAGVATTTAREWISLLETSFILFRLTPWHANIGKRLVKMPKLYFYDVGLAVHLCGVEEAGQLKNHPLKGAFFENLVIGDLLKTRFNHGRDSRLCFYRDSSGKEVDLLYPLGPDFLPVEIKSGQTVSREWFSGLRTFAKVRPDSGPPGLVVYGGDQAQQRTHGAVCGWRDLPTALKEYAG